MATAPSGRSEWFTAEPACFPVLHKVIFLMSPTERFSLLRSHMVRLSSQGGEVGMLARSFGAHRLRSCLCATSSLDCSTSFRVPKVREFVHSREALFVEAYGSWKYPLLSCQLVMVCVVSLELWITQHAIDRLLKRTGVVECFYPMS